MMTSLGPPCIDGEGAKRVETLNVMRWLAFGHGLARSASAAGRRLTRRWPLALLVAAVAADSSAPIQSQASFAAAVRNHSTAPSYVLITIVDDTTHRERSTCTTSNLLLGAIHLEHGLAYDKRGEEEAERLTLSNRDHLFHFSKPKALANIPFSFSEADRKAIRARLAPLSIDELRSGFSGSGELHSIYRVTPREKHQAYRDATACVLIERGLSPGQGDRSDQLWLTP